MRRLLTCLALLFSLPAMAEIFSYTDANGNQVFTNEPPQGSNAQIISLPPTNGATAPPASSSSPAPQDDSSAATSQPVSNNPSPPPSTQVTTNPNDDDGDNYDNNLNVDQPRREALGEPRVELREPARR
ncbi:MAG: DUF4124 domain-containing protein [Pseudomonadaceae bacterium]|jgi:hypothetical protein|nr:DUF4124 domain-containing protein [Pseudomonadaceae bacterium]